MSFDLDENTNVVQNKCKNVVATESTTTSKTFVHIESNLISVTSTAKSKIISTFSIQYEEYAITKFIGQSGSSIRQFEKKHDVRVSFQNYNRKDRNRNIVMIISATAEHNQHIKKILDQEMSIFYRSNLPNYNTKIFDEISFMYSQLGLLQENQSTLINGIVSIIFEQNY
jgi:predicted PilT family ATPase